jgi:hypothetical protein
MTWCGPLHYTPLPHPKLQITQYLCIYVKPRQSSALFLAFFSRCCRLIVLNCRRAQWHAQCCPLSLPKLRYHANQYASSCPKIHLSLSTLKARKFDYARGGFAPPRQISGRMRSGFWSEIRSLPSPCTLCMRKQPHLVKSNTE